MTTSVAVGVTVTVELAVPLGGYSQAGSVKVVVMPAETVTTTDSATARGRRGRRKRAAERISAILYMYCKRGYQYKVRPQRSGHQLTCSSIHNKITVARIPARFLSTRTMPSSTSSSPHLPPSLGFSSSPASSQDLGRKRDIHPRRTHR
jgi:hypothetical protein